MTQETRIGLVVGLMFIVAFGLILAELTGGPAELPAPGQVGDEGVLWNPASVGLVPVDVESPIELPAAEPVVEVEADVKRPGGQPQPQPQEALAAVPPQPHPAVEKPNPEPSPIAAQIILKPERPAPRYYKVQPNDTLIRIARKFYGRGNEDKYRLIYEANRDVLEDESSLYVGQELLIPPLGVEGSKPAGPRYVEMDENQLRSYFQASNQGDEALRRDTYTVKPGDTLTRIARQVLNDPSPAAVRRLFEANRDKLADPDELIVGMELEIPTAREE